MKKDNLKGRRFGRLTVLKDSGKRKRGFVAWLCKCNCGNLVEARSDNLKSGNTESCGCLNREKLREKLFKHGGAGTRLYRIWANIKSRCCNPKAYGYKYHGRKGIIVCPEWKNDFVAFRNWALNNGYADNLFTIRVDKSGNYEPSNIQFLTKSESIRKQWRERRLKPSNC